jgi:hypothetical protein
MNRRPDFDTVLTCFIVLAAESLAFSRGYRALLLAKIEPTTEALKDWARRHPEASMTGKDCGRERDDFLRSVPEDIRTLRQWNLRPYGTLRACVYTVRTIRELAEEEERVLQDVQPSTLRQGGDALERTYNALDEIRAARKSPSRLP